MYDIKELIERMKSIANITTNVQLAQIFNVSYNTLNTWIKRKKLPQEQIIQFCEKYSCSLDFLIFNKERPTPSSLFTQTETTPTNSDTKTQIEESYDYKFKGIYEPLQIEPGDRVTLNKDALVTPAYYLINKDGIELITLVRIDPFRKIVEVPEYNYSLTLEQFQNINQGLIEK
jgi:hypothetical protein